MKKRWLLLVVGIAACASMDALPGEADGSPDGIGASTDAAASPDSESDAARVEPDPGSCRDCEYFPESCSEDVLCPNGPFEPNTPGGSLDPRAQISVIRGRSTSDVWAAGALGALAHFDGTSWSRSDPGHRETLRALWLRDSAELALAMLHRIYVREDGGATPPNGGWTVRSSLRPSEYPPAIFNPPFFLSGCAPSDSEWLWCTTRTWLPDSTSGLWRVRQRPSMELEIGVGIPTSVCQSIGCLQMLGIHGATDDDLWAHA